MSRSVRLAPTQDQLPYPASHFDYLCIDLARSADPTTTTTTTTTTTYLGVLYRDIEGSHGDIGILHRDIGVLYKDI